MMIDDVTECRQPIMVHQSTVTTSCFSQAIFIVIDHGCLSHELKTKVFIVISAN